jgi:hypothetical protein
MTTRRPSGREPANPATRDRVNRGCGTFGGSEDATEVRNVLTAANHFGHRETDDIVVDLFWSRGVGDEFRVEVEDRREHVRLVLYPTTGKEAIHAFYHPFAVARGARYYEVEIA